MTGAAFLSASCLLPMLPFSLQLSSHPTSIIIPISEPCPHHSPCLHPLFCPWIISGGGWGLSSRACCCDLDFKARRFLVLTVREHCFWPSLAGPPLGPLSGCTWVCKCISACFSWGSCWPCCLAYCVFVSQCLPPREACLFWSK